MHFGYNNPCLEYIMGWSKLTMTESEEDLGVVIHSTLKSAAHLPSCLKKANQMLGTINRTITYKIDIQYFFTQRVIDYWNALPQTAIDAESINHFKDQLNVQLYNIIRGLKLMDLTKIGKSWKIPF